MILLIFVLLYTASNWMKCAGLVLAFLPFATIGGTVAPAMTGQCPLVTSVIGFIAVFGMAMIDRIALVSFLNEQR